MMCNVGVPNFNVYNAKAVALYTCHRTQALQHTVTAAGYRPCAVIHAALNQVLLPVGLPP